MFSILHFKRGIRLNLLTKQLFLFTNRLSNVLTTPLILYIFYLFSQRGSIVYACIRKVKFRYSIYTVQCNVIGWSTGYTSINYLIYLVLVHDTIYWACSQSQYSSGPPIRVYVLVTGSSIAVRRTFQYRNIYVIDF